jgi:Flp pilus assembly protein CpaB
MKGGMGCLSRKKVIGTLVLVAFVLLAVYMFVPVNGQTKTFKVYMAKDAIPPGKILEANMIRTKEVLQLENWMMTDLNQVKGMVSSTPIPKDRFIDVGTFTTDIPILFQQGEGEYTVRTKPEYANGGRIAAGDLVNVIYVPRPNGNNKEDGQGEVIAREVMVLSVRTQFGGDVHDGKGREDDPSKAPFAVTLKSSESISTVLAAKQENGFISLHVVKKGGIVTK